jgi:hypothetical protein
MVEKRKNKGLSIINDGLAAYMVTRDPFTLCGHAGPMCIPETNPWKKYIKILFYFSPLHCTPSSSTRRVNSKNIFSKLFFSCFGKKRSGYRAPFRDTFVLKEFDLFFSVCSVHKVAELNNKVAKNSKKIIFKKNKINSGKTNWKEFWGRIF